MTENERDAIEGRARRELRESKSALACLNLKRDKIVEDLRAVVAFLEKPNFRRYSLSPKNRIRLEGLRPVYPKESEIVEWLCEYEKRTRAVKKLNRELKRIT